MPQAAAGARNREASSAAVRADEREPGTDTRDLVRLENSEEQRLAAAITAGDFGFVAGPEGGGGGLRKLGERDAQDRPAVRGQRGAAGGGRHQADGRAELCGAAGDPVCGAGFGD